MKNRIPTWLLASLLIAFWSLPAMAQRKTAARKTPPLSDRPFWLTELDKMVRPVLYNLAHDSLRIAMPQIVSKRVDNREQRIKVQYVEVLGRVLSGIAPWLQGEGGSADEVALRNQYRQWALKGLSNALDSTARDYMRFDLGGQQLVDASFIALGLIRAPWLWENLSKTDQERWVQALKSTRRYKPGFSNWLLFSALNEAFLCQYGYDWDPMRVDYALQQLEQWYVGDGMYSDGPSYAFDYYNSYVIHPYLAAITEIIAQKTTAYNGMIAKIKKRNERYAILQERLINADGTFPVTGRSIVYRGAVFQHLADVARRKTLPESLKPAQVRGALTAVIRKTLESPSTYEKGWLTIGLYGSQPDLADVYNNQGSLYLATNIFLPLGLPPTDPFWADAPAKWSAQKIWSGEDFPNDHGVNLR
ncbi:DUF2264 domain-containing protein [Larkinella ripae]